MTELESKQTPKTQLRLFGLINPVMGYKYAIVSVKPDGIDNLSASVFVWLTNHNDIQKPQKEIYFDCGKEYYRHDEVLNLALLTLPKEHLPA